MPDSSPKHDYACMVCGTTLIYGESDQKLVCDYCGKEVFSQIHCPEEHFVCDECHSADALSFLDRMAESETSLEPREIVETAFRHPSFSFHGPEHHALVPAAILIAMKNRGYNKAKGDPINEVTIREGIRRGSKIPGGFCGSAGNCGACVGAGIVLALFVGSTPKKAAERKVAHETTVAALERSLDGLIRCCKRATFYGIATAMEILNERYGLDIGTSPQVESCENFEKNRDCAKEECVFYPISN